MQEEDRERREAEKKWKIEQEAKFRAARAVMNWGRVAARYVKIRDLKAVAFKRQARQMKQEVKEDLQKWRSLLQWDDDGRIVEPPKPEPRVKDPTLREWWCELWDQERSRTCGEEEEARLRHIAEMERQRQVHAEEEAKRVLMLPENRTTEEIWEELVELDSRLRFAYLKNRAQIECRRSMLRKEAFKRTDKIQSRPVPVTAADIRKEIAEIQTWLQKYEKLDDADKSMYRCRLGNLTRGLKPLEEKEEKLRQERQRVRNLHNVRNVRKPGDGP
jgi:hypothetical protein